jgi:hypothetical protein
MKKNTRRAKEVRKCVTTSDRKVMDRRNATATEGYRIVRVGARITWANKIAKNARKRIYATDSELK